MSSWKTQVTEMITCVKDFEYRSVLKKTQASKASSPLNNAQFKGDNIVAVEEMRCCAMERGTKEEEICNCDAVQTTPVTMSQTEADFLYYYSRDRF